MMVGLLLASSWSVASAQPKAGKGSYRIEVQIPQLRDTLLYMVSYFGKSNSKIDSAKTDAAGRAVFDADSSAPVGMYMLVLKGNKDGNIKLYDFIVSDEQHFSMTTDTTNYTGKMKIKGSKENQLLFDYLRFLSDKSDEVKPIRQRLEAAKGDPKKEQAIRDELKVIDNQVKEYQKKLIAENPKTLLSKFVRMVQEIEVPDPPKKPDGSIDSTFGYWYYRRHFFDNYDFNDERIWRTPVFYDKVEFFLEKMIPQHPDTIAKEAIAIVERARGNKELFKYLAANLTYKYETSKIVGQDAIFVQLALKYYTNNQAYWVEDSIAQKIVKRAKKLEPILVGKTAPNLIMQDSLLQLRQLYDIKNRFTVLFFMDPDCGHCKKESVKLKEIYDRYHKEWDMQVFQVFADTSMEKMRKYIRENNLRWINVNGPRNLNTPYHDLYDINSTPQIFIINDERKIIMKRIAAEQIEDFMKHYIKNGDS